MPTSAAGNRRRAPGAARARPAWGFTLLELMLAAQAMIRRLEGIPALVHLLDEIDLEKFERAPNTRRNMLTTNFKESLAQHSEQLDIIQRNMRRYLEGRRGQVPRLYFLSDEDIFEILGKSRDLPELPASWAAAPRCRPS